MAKLHWVVDGVTRVQRALSRDDIDLRYSWKVEHFGGRAHAVGYRSPVAGWKYTTQAAAARAANRRNREAGVL